MPSKLRDRDMKMVDDAICRSSGLQMSTAIRQERRDLVEIARAAGELLGACAIFLPQPSVAILDSRLSDLAAALIAWEGTPISHVSQLKPTPVLQSSPDSTICPHGIDISTARCADCRQQRPR